MLKFYAAGFVAALRDLQAVQARAEERKDLPESAHLRNLCNPLKQLSTSLKSIGLEDLARRVSYLAERCGKNIPLAAAHYQVKELDREMRETLQEVLFLRVEKPYEHHYEESGLSEAAKRAFPDVDEELADAGSCLALGQSTAAVMHAMRAADHLICWMAERLDLSAEAQSWKPTLNQIEKALKGLDNKPRTEQATLGLSRLSEAATHFNQIRQAWRNYVMHGRERYEERKAAKILEQIGGIADSLAPLAEEPGL